MKLRDITPRFLTQYYQKLLKTPAVKNPSLGNKSKNEFVGMGTIRDVHKLLNCCFRQAIKWELMDRNPAENATVPKYKMKKRDIWTADDLMKALDCCKDEQLKIAINLAFSCSLRMGELLGLTWDCVDISEEAIRQNRAYIFINKEIQRVRIDVVKALDGKDIITTFPQKTKLCKTVKVLKTPKTESSIRKVFLPETVARMLVEWKKKQDEIREFLGGEYEDYNMVLASSTGIPLEESRIRLSFNKLIKENDLPKVVFHSLRHSSVTYKLKLNGGDIKSVQGDSGHSQINMITDVYSHIIDDDRKKNAELFEKEFYRNKNTNPQFRTNEGENTVTIPQNVDPELVNNLLSNPEALALLQAFAKTMK